MTQQGTIEQLRAVVAAKLAYWDAIRKLEQSLAAPGDDLSDKDSDTLEDFISVLASGLNDASEVDKITETYVAQLRAKLKSLQSS
jgi:hypothetical protein